VGKYILDRKSGSDATFVKAQVYLAHGYTRIGFIRALAYLNISLVALESRKLRQIRKVTGTRSLTTLAPHAFPLFPITQSSIQATDHNLSYAGRDVLHHLSSSCRCNCDRAIPGNLPSTRGFLCCGADRENGYRVNQPSSATPSTDQRHLPMECGASR
jgi:hypothetical protein